MSNGGYTTRTGGLFLPSLKGLGVGHGGFKFATSVEEERLREEDEDTYVVQGDPKCPLHQYTYGMCVVCVCVCVWVITLTQHTHSRYELTQHTDSGHTHIQPPRVPNPATTTPVEAQLLWYAQQCC